VPAIPGGAAIGDPPAIRDGERVGHPALAHTALEPRALVGGRTSLALRSVEGRRGPHGFKDGVCTPQ
jgi:hypothetical protein